MINLNQKKQHCTHTKIRILYVEIIFYILRNRNIHNSNSEKPLSHEAGLLAANSPAGDNYHCWFQRLEVPLHRYIISSGNPLVRYRTPID